MEYNKKNMIIGISMLTPFLNQVSNSIVNLKYLIYLPFFLVIILYYFRKDTNNIHSRSPKNTPVNIIIILLILSYTISPIVGLTIFKYAPLENIIYIILFILFIINLGIYSKIIDSNSKYKYFLKIILLGNSIVLIPKLITNMDQLQMIDFSTILTADRSIRANFELSHPNTASMYILIEMLLIYLIYVRNNKVNIFSIVSIIILLPFLIATGSRTANISMVLFIVLEIYSKFISSFSKYVRVMISIVFITIVFLVIIYKFDFSNLLNNMSGRDRSFINNINAIEVYGNYIFGISPTSINTLNEICMLDFADNWYIVQFIQFGGIGILLFFITLFIFIYKFIQNRDYLSINLLIVILIYSSAERVLFVPGVTLSWIVFTLLFIHIKNNVNIYKI